MIRQQWHFSTHYPWYHSDSRSSRRDRYHLQHHRLCIHLPSLEINDQHFSARLRTGPHWHFKRCILRQLEYYRGVCVLLRGTSQAGHSRISQIPYSRFYFYFLGVSPIIAHYTHFSTGSITQPITQQAVFRVVIIYLATKFGSFLFVSLPPLPPPQKKYKTCTKN